MNQTITIDPEFRDMLIPLPAEELAGLEESIKADRCLAPLIVWPTESGNILIDGHNRYEICTRLGLPYSIEKVDLPDRESAKLWIIRNQRQRRNLGSFALAELALQEKSLIAALAKANQRLSEGRGVKGLPNLANLINTRATLAAEAGISHGTLSKVEAVLASGDKELIQKARRKEVSVDAAYKEVRRDQARAELAAKVEELRSSPVQPADGKYDVIVIDPPWPMEKIERDVRPNQASFDYPTMSEGELGSFSIPAADDCHLWMWTTHRFLPMAMRLLVVWGFKYVCTFVWHKPGGFQPVGLPQYNCEFVLYARRGTPKFIDTKAFPVCFEAPRGKHSEKPEEFYEIVRRVTAGRRIDIFNRRPIEGFDVWGNEAV